MNSTAPNIPLGLYVHIPWCERKCPYCDFNSHVAKVEVDEASYTKALLTDLARDLEHYAPLIDERQLQSIFIGGGTPSLFTPQSISDVLSGIESQIPFYDDIEITLEANPGSAEADRFSGFKQAGVNRLSIGVQSFDNKQLQNLGRIHRRKEAIAAAEYAVAAGLHNFNLDLMFGLPGQTTDEALGDLERAIQLQPAHLSCYQLTIEPNTLFHKHPPIRPDDEALWAMQTALQARLPEAGYTQYEVSAYSRAERRCRHNLNYWQFGDYLGIGAGAHGKLSSAELGIERYWKVKHPQSYQTRCESDLDPAGARTQVAEDQRSFEFMLNALRLTDGFSSELFQQRTFIPLVSIQQQLQNHETLGLISVSDNYIKPTPRGETMIDSMLQDYLA